MHNFRVRQRAVAKTMKIVASCLFVLVELIACSEPEVSNVEYNRGRQRAEIEGCHCNNALPRTRNPENAGPLKGWTDGYIEACTRFRRERNC